MTDTIIILAPADDLHAITVSKAIYEIDKGCNVVLLDTADFPSRWTLSQHYTEIGAFTLTHETQTITHHDVKSIWLRRPKRANLPGVKDPELQHFCQEESWAHLSGWLTRMGRKVVNPVTFDNAAEWKPYQLDVAKTVGFCVPDTLITNCVKEATSFFHKHQGQIIFKVLTDFSAQLMETRPLKETDLNKLTGLKSAPVIFQENLGAGGDLRVAVIGNDVFASQINAQLPKGLVDWRLDTAAEYMATEISEDFKSQCLKLVKTMGLHYGALDFMRGKDGKYRFIEINPGGQFLFQEVHSGHPTAQAFANLLLTLPG